MAFSDWFIPERIRQRQDQLIQARTTVNVAMLVVSTGDLMMFGISAVALIVLAYVIQKTRLGRALRAVSFDRDTAQLTALPGRSGHRWPD